MANVEDENKINSDASELTRLETTLNGLINQYNAIQSQLGAVSNDYQTINHENVYVTSVDNNPTVTYLGAYASFAGGASQGNNFTKQQCQKSALNAGYPYFSLQAFDSTTKTAQCTLYSGPPTGSSLTPLCNKASDGYYYGSNKGIYSVYSTSAYSKPAYQGCFTANNQLLGISTTTNVASKTALPTNNVYAYDIGNNIVGNRQPLPIETLKIQPIKVINNNIITGYPDATAKDYWNTPWMSAVVGDILIFTFTFNNVNSTSTCYIYGIAFNSMMVYYNGKLVANQENWFVDETTHQPVYASAEITLKAGIENVFQCECYPASQYGSFRFTAVDATNTSNVLFNTSENLKSQWRCYKAGNITAEQCNNTAIANGFKYFMMMPNSLMQALGGSPSASTNVCYASNDYTSITQNDNGVTKHDNYYYGTTNPAVYKVETKGNKNNLFSAGYVYENNVKKYDKTTLSNSGNYVKVKNAVTSDVLANAGINGVTVETAENCKTLCTSKEGECTGFIFNNNATAGAKNCVLQGVPQVPPSNSVTMAGYDTYYSIPLAGNSESSGCPTSFRFIDSVEWDKYNLSTELMDSHSTCGLVTNTADLMKKLQQIGQEINSIVAVIGNIVQNLDSQSDTVIVKIGLNRESLQEKINKYKGITNQFSQYSSTNNDNIVNDTSIKLSYVNSYYTAYMVIVLLILIAIAVLFFV